MIFVLIAGTYTPVALLALKGTLQRDPDRAVGRSARRRVFKLAWIDAPKWLFAAVYVVLGLVVGGGLRRAARRRSAGSAWRGWRSVGCCTSPAR